MNNKIKKLRRGITIVEFVIAAIASLIVLTAVTVILVDSQRGFNNIYAAINGDVVTSSYVAKSKFDSVVRKSSYEECLIDTDGQWLEVNYYASGSSASIDSFARFYTDAGNLCVEYGTLNPKQTISVETICSNVTECIFKKEGRGAQMILTLDDQRRSITTVTSAVMHN